MSKNYFLFYTSFCDLDNKIDEIIVNNSLDNNHLVYYYDNYHKVLTKDEIINVQNLFFKQRDELLFLVVKNFELLNKEITNSLLLFLEDLPKNSFCIFTSSKEEFILKTIKSRCEIIYISFQENIFNNIIKKLNYQLDKYFLEMIKNNFFSVREIQEFLEKNYDKFKKNNNFINNLEFSNWPNILSLFKDLEYKELLYFLQY